MVVGNFHWRDCWDWILDRSTNKVLAIVVCALGRGLDFATTWIALHYGLAAEAKPGASHLLSIIGPSHGLVIYEFWITTPAIFMGVYLAGKLHQSRRPSARGTPTQSAENLLLYGIGAISFLVAAWNVQFLV